MVKLNNNLLHLSLREAFLDIVPYYVLSSMGLVLIDVFNVDPHSQNTFIHALLSISNVFTYLFPIFLVIAISYHLANNYHIHRFIVIALSLSTFMSVSWSIDDQLHLVYDKDMTLYALFLPICCMYLYRYLIQFTFIQLIKEDIVSRQLKIVINSILPVFFIYMLFVNFIPSIGSIIYEYLHIWFIREIQILGVEVKAFFQVVVVHLIWWSSGIHGTHVYTIFADTTYLFEDIFTNVSAEVFLFNFLVAGGAGATLSLVIAIIWKSKNYYTRKIGYLALPFSIFNINEILIFGLPMIMNFKFLIPFIGLPIINFFTTYAFFSYVSVPEIQNIITWSTPAIISGYLMGNGEDFSFAFLQLFNIVLGVFIYLPFLKAYDEENKNSYDVNKLKDKFHIREQISNMQEIDFLKTQAEQIAEQTVIHNLVDELVKGDLHLYYQPKIDAKTNEIYGFEALLRFENKKGKILGPYFIPQLEQSGYAGVIDIWVINKISKDIAKWEEKNQSYNISINISPESLSNRTVVNKIIAKLKNKNVSIEILERTFAKEHNIFLDNIKLLKDNGFIIYVDDFGTGFSSLQYLHILPVDKIKLDRTLLLNTKTNEGKILYKDIAIMCKDLGYKIVSEGVETKEEEEFLKSIDIDILQGYLYSPAIAFDEVQNYVEKYNKD